jgi:hypothetical protein
VAVDVCIKPSALGHLDNGVGTPGCAFLNNLPNSLKVGNKYWQVLHPKLTRYFSLKTKNKNANLFRKSEYL